MVKEITADKFLGMWAQYMMLFGIPDPVICICLAIMRRTSFVLQISHDALPL